MTKRHDISKHAGTYANCLAQTLQTVIYPAWSDSKVSTEEFKQKILTSIEPASNTQAKAKFIQTLLSKKNKDDILFFVQNSYLRGSGLGSNIDDKFSR